MVDIDIPVSAPLQKALQPLSCDVLKLPSPSPLHVTLPTGTKINALVDMSKGIPTDCSMNFNLMLQMAPLLAALDCPMKILKTIKGLLDVLNGLPDVTKIPKFIDDTMQDLGPCFLALSNIPIMVMDLLKLIRSVLNCLLGQLQSLRDLMNGLSLRFGDAAGNPDLLATLQCAQNNAAAQAGSLATSIDPIAGVIALVQPFAAMAGMKIDISLDTGGAPASSTEGLDAIIGVLRTAVDAIGAIVGE